MVAIACIAGLGLVSAHTYGTQQAAQSPAAGQSIRLQVITMTPLPDRVLEAVVDEAAAIWAPYGVTVTATRQLVRPQVSPDQWITLIVRDASLPGPGRPFRDGRQQLAGLVFTAGVPGHLMTASWNVARDMAAGAGLPGAAGNDLAARLLGRAVAHEIGHYLLRTRDHAPRGLMRAVFTVRDVRGDRSELLLEPAQIRALEAGTAGR